jgi:tetraacyldisaccharide 4'-kinase
MGETVVRAPDFWGKGNAGLVSTVLLPLSWIYGLVARVRFMAARPWRAPVPVLCIGNLVAGGAGKTPVALDIGARLLGRGVAVHFLTRGYGGRNAGPLRVDPDRHDFHEVGDEALLLARCAPTWVARDRVAGARAAIAAGAAAIVMDDGFQNPSLEKDLSLVVVDGGHGFGNGRLMPAGPLRETVTAGLARAQGVVIIGADETGVAQLSPRVLRARLKPGPEAASLSGKAVVAFAGIGDPGKFFDTLRAVECRVEAAHAFPDHHPFTETEIERLCHQARDLGVVPVTTAKDAVRLPSNEGNEIKVLTITLEWEDEAALDTILRPVMDGKK